MNKFLESPLVEWVQSLHAEPLTYVEICRGSALNKLLAEIDPRAVPEGVDSLPGEDTKELLENWDLLMRNIKAYYRDVLAQFIVMRLPDLTQICHDPESAEAQAEIQKVLLLLLGCAVQCDAREHFVQEIKHLNVTTQQVIMEHIQEVMDDSVNVFAIDIPLDQMHKSDAVDAARHMHEHMKRLVSERDAYVERVKGLVCAIDDLSAEVEHNRQVSAQPKVESISPEKTRGGSGDGTKIPVAEELADVKALVRTLRQELDEKTEMLAELQEDINEHKTTVSKLRTENVELTQDARAARTYRDELDILKEKASKVDKHEAEIQKYKEKLNELDFYKSRVDELRDDNSTLHKMRDSLEEQLAKSSQRIETVVALEEELLLSKQDLAHLSQERDEDRQRIKDLNEEIARLEFANKDSFNESANLEQELNKARRQNPGGMSNTLSDQLNETANTRILRLELENQNLKKKLQESNETQMLESATKVLELEKENRRLANKVDKLQTEKQLHSKGTIELEETTSELSRENKQLLECLETVKESSDRQVRELECEKEQLEQMVETLRERNEKTQDLHVKETERENKKLHESVKNLTSQLSNTTYEHRQLQKTYEQIKTTAHGLEHLKEDNVVLEHKNVDLEKEVTVLKLSCDQYEQLEQQYLDTEVERDKLLKTVERLKKTCARQETVEEENTSLKVECQHLKRMVENMKNSSSQVADLEQDKDRMNREIQMLKRQLDGSALDRTKQEQLEVDLLEMDTENQRLERKVEALSRRVAELEQDNTDLDTHTDNLQKNLETMRISLRKMDDIEHENKDMEREMSRLSKEKAALEKENKKLKQLAESYEAQTEDLNSRLTALDRENKSFKRHAAQSKDTNARIRELEKEKSDLVEQATADRKTLNSLREELVQEKIQAQDVTNEVEHLRNELERKTIGSEKQQAATDYTKTLETLEHRLEGGLKQSITLKDEKIASLESRLEAARKHNLKVQEELNNVRQDYEAVVQQNEDIVKASISGKPQHLRQTEVPNATKEILKLKDQMITLERTNASLEEEVKYLKSSSDGHKLQAANAQVENSKYQSQVSSLQTQYNMLQSQCANLQVDNQALQAQCSSLTSEAKAIEKQRRELEHEHEDVIRTHMEQQNQQEVLASDHDQLSKLHEKLASAYEALISEHGSLKANFKAMKSENRQLQDKLQYMGREKETVSQLKEMLEKDKESFRSDSQLKIDYVRLKEELMQTQHMHEKLRNDLQNLDEDYRKLQAENNKVRQHNSSLSGQLTDSREQVGQLNMEVTALINKLESCTALNEKLEDDNRNLMMQMQALLNQNHELLTGCLDSKDQLAEEQKAYTERLAELRSQKEKLEEKIMEQYKRYDPVKKKSRGFGNFMRRLVKGRSKSQSKLNSSESPDNMSIGSGDNNPKLSSQSKAMAKSTTALNMSQDINGSKNPSFSIRGAKSTENIALDNDSLGSSPRPNQRSGTTEWQQTPIRSRQVLESSSVSSMGHGSRSGSVAVPDEDSDSEMTLEQFLKECDKSPKSRKKMIQEMKEQEKNDLKKNRRSNTPKPEPETMVLSPDLGPRAPTVEQDQTNRSPFKSKSEMNLSKLSSGSSMEYSDRYSPMTSSRYDITTSTPKQQDAQYSRNGGRYNQRPLSHQSSQESYTNSHTMPRQNSGSSGNSSSIGGYNAVTRTTNNMVRSHTLGGGLQPLSVNNGSSSSPRGDREKDSRYDPRLNPLPNRSTPPVRRPTTPGSHYTHHQQQQQQQQQHHNEPSPYNPPPPQQHDAYPQNHQHNHQPAHQQNQQPQPQQPPRDDSSYNPGNVRNLVQNYQISMNNSVNNNNISTGGSNGPSNGPSTPPRRSRPMSAGPLRSSSNSAFSVPQPSSFTAYNPERNTGRALPRRPEGLTTGRTLPRTPDSSLNAPGKMSAPPQPPRPQSQGPPKDGPPKNPTWYEYGCV